MLIYNNHSMNAAGTCIPPVIMWPRKNVKAEFMNGAQVGSLTAFHPSGWVQMDIITRWFDHFIKFVKPTTEEAVLSIPERHFHTVGLELIGKARKNHIAVVYLPSHSSHLM
jgi:hypothetical protein